MILGILGTQLTVPQRGRTQSTALPHSVAQPKVLLDCSTQTASLPVLGAQPVTWSSPNEGDCTATDTPPDSGAESLAPAKCSTQLGDPPDQ